MWGESQLISLRVAFLNGINPRNLVQVINILLSNQPKSQIMRPFR